VQTEFFQGNFAKLSQIQGSRFLHAGQPAESVPLNQRPIFQLEGKHGEEQVNVLSGLQIELLELGDGGKCV